MLLKLQELKADRVSIISDVVDQTVRFISNCCYILIGFCEDPYGVICV